MNCKQFNTIPLEEVLQIFVVPNLHHVPVIQTRTADGLFGDVKAQRPDQVQTAACCGAGAGDIAAVLRYLRFHQNNIQHTHHPGGCRVGLFSQNPLVFYCKSNGR